MPRRPLYQGSKFRHVYGKPATKEHSYDGVPITRGVHDNHCCSANPCFIAVVTECAGGGSFLVLPVHHVGRVDPQTPRVCGHSDRVLDVRWNPFDDHCIASCSEDCTVKLWDIPVCGVQQNITWARKTLIGHSRRVGLIEWHPTAKDLLLSSAYDHQVLLWDISQPGCVLRCPVRVLSSSSSSSSSSSELLLSVSFNTDGRRLVTASRDRRVRILDPRTGTVLQASHAELHRVSKVVYAGDLNLLVSTGTSCWNQRQVLIWDPDDLSEPLVVEDLDSSAGVLFPFYDPDTHMLYLAGKGDCNIRYFELSSEKPYLTFLAEYRSQTPQTGLGVMPKRGMDVSVCEVFRFYRLVTVKDLVEPLSMIIPRRTTGTFHEDLFPMTTGDQAAMTAQEWLSGINRGPVLVSLKPGTKVVNPYPETAADKGMEVQLRNLRFQSRTGWDQEFLQEQLSYQDAKYPRELSDLSGWQADETQALCWAYCSTPHCCEPAERPPPDTERELLQAFYMQQEEIRELKEELDKKEVWLSVNNNNNNTMAMLTRLELEMKNTRNNMRATF
ncbi:coronin-2A-like [Aplochiton taeniatus]